MIWTIGWSYTLVFKPSFPNYSKEEKMSLRAPLSFKTFSTWGAFVYWGNF